MFEISPEEKQPFQPWVLSRDAQGGCRIHCGGRLLFPADARADHNADVGAGAQHSALSSNTDSGFTPEELERLVACVNGCRGLAQPQNLPEALKIIKRISAGCPAKPGRWLYDHEMAELAAQALKLLRE